MDRPFALHLNEHVQNAKLNQKYVPTRRSRILAAILDDFFTTIKITQMERKRTNKVLPDQTEKEPVIKQNL